MEQESQKRELEDSVGQTLNNGPILCANNCGFFGSASTNNLFSKCYRDFFLKQSKNAVVDKEKKLEQAMIVETVNHVIEEVDQSDVMPAEVGTSSEDPGNQPTNTNRCNFCRKRVGLTGFKCRCGYTFCNLHRYSDKHNCSFDYKGAGQDAIAKANPVVKADKIEKI